ncbi:hypothetical protein A8709_32795 [Paenibacillus pectinilyticus]|uniref:Beta-glucosidase n=2 Tax=Paenibacillus pectinilyticus TaxID=512399 RepID=A0A1C0ZXG0_9BACL|nr:hypothetical protein A8709_32795 [Paenibacillus pectinilyticus]
MNKDFVRKGSYTNEISFPLGGIGSGSIGLAGNGRLFDWEIFNRPNKNSYNGFSFFAIKAEHNGTVKVSKILNGDLHPPYTGSGSENFQGFGFGVARESMAGFTHFTSTSFKGEFPFAEIQFEDESVPLDVKLTAYNPFIPLNDKDSSIPAAILAYEVTNQSDVALDISVVGNLTNPAAKGAINEYRDFGSFKGMNLYSKAYKEDAPEFGDMTLSTDNPDVSYQSYWYRGGWFDNLTVFWKEFSAPGRFKERYYETTRDNTSTNNLKDVCLLSAHQKLAPGETGVFRFMITWSYPNFENFWNPGITPEGTLNPNPVWKNYYATLFQDSTASARYVWENHNQLYSDTMAFKELLFRSTLPDVVIDAISSTISVLKTATCVRLTDGTLYGFEGVHAHEGSCEGSCTHVWNYEQATAFLFPALARGMREVDFKYALHSNGKMTFRLFLPVERTIKENHHRAAADGQMGGIIKTYREWKISGDTEWLKLVWPKVKSSLEYAWDATNEDLWDLDKDGVMEGRQHHTLDMELFGPNSWLTGYYLTALKAAAEMAGHLGERDKQEEYLKLCKSGSDWANKHLFNGEYYHQSVNLKDRTLLEKFEAEQTYWNEETQEMKYQIAEGCEIDQVIGQWFAHIVGLGYVFEKDQVKTALSNLFKNNFVECFRNYVNACRIYAVNDDKGLVIATWPKNNSPKIPIPYQDETQNGYEYQAACHLIYEGLIDEGLSVVKAIRDRYDGLNRNPWNEFECGSNYARSMASYGFLLALSGFQYDMVRGHIGFDPKINQDQFRCFYSLHTGWGEFVHNNGQLSLQVQYGSLGIRSLGSDLLANKEIAEVKLDGAGIPFTRQENIILFNEEVRIEQGSILAVSTN